MRKHYIASADKTAGPILTPDSLRNPNDVRLMDLVRRNIDEQTAEENRQKAAAEREMLEAEGKALHDKFIDIVENGDPVDSDTTRDAIFELLVPSSGMCSTLAGELFRAFFKLSYRYYNDGDYFFVGYGLETAGPAAMFLSEYGVEIVDKLIWDTQEDLTKFSTDDFSNIVDSEYETFLSDLFINLVEFVKSDATLFAVRPPHDMLKTDTSALEDSQPLYEYELTIPDKIQTLVQLGVLKGGSPSDYIEDILQNDRHVFGDAKVDSYGWNDCYVNVEDLTYDGFYQLKEMDDESLWEGLTDEIAYEDKEAYNALFADIDNLSSDELVDALWKLLEYAGRLSCSDAAESICADNGATDDDSDTLGMDEESIQNAILELRDLVIE